MLNPVFKFHKLYIAFVMNCYRERSTFAIKVIRFLCFNSRMDKTKSRLQLQHVAPCCVFLKDVFSGWSGFQFMALHLFPKHTVYELEVIGYSN